MKKYLKFLFLLLCITISIAGCSNNKEISTTTIENVKETEKEDTKETENIKEIEKENTKETEKKEGNEENEEIQYEEFEDKITIVIDPGHSSVGNSEKENVGPNSSETKAKDVIGATGNYTKIPEYETNLSVGLLLKKELDSRGYNVIMTKTEASQSLSNIERANIGNKNKANLVVRIHADSNNNTSIKGASMQIPGKNQYTSSFYDISKEYGEKIINTYATELNLVNRGLVYRDDLTGFNWSKVPVVLLEMGFLSNKEDDLFISNIENHEKMARVIADGIDKCFK